MKKHKALKDEATEQILDANVEAQLVELQMNVAHLELTVEQLNLVITKQDHQLRTLQRQLQLLYQQIEGAQEDSGIAPFNLIDDKPPHY